MSEPILHPWVLQSPSSFTCQCRYQLRIVLSKVKDKRQKHKGGNGNSLPVVHNHWYFTSAGPLLYSPLEVSRVPPAKCWDKATGQEPSKCEWAHFFLCIISFLGIPFIQPQRHPITFHLTQQKIFKKIKGYVNSLAEENCSLSYLEAFIKIYKVVPYCLPYIPQNTNILHIITAVN